MAEQMALDVLGSMSRARIVSETELIRQLNVSRTSLWRMRSNGLPFLSLGRLVRYDLDDVEAWLARKGEFLGDDRLPDEGRRIEPDLPPCHWSLAVALDPKHRPQLVTQPASTVRREWWRFPQEAHLLDEQGNRYRRLRADEVAIIQGFPRDWATHASVGELDRFRGFGDAVPPPLARALFEELRAFLPAGRRTSIEVCAGFGGLALGATQGLELEHLGLIERWAVACSVLRTSGAWRPEVVIEADVRDVDFRQWAGHVTVLSGGPPCQPWSNAGKGLGSEDERDLLGHTPDMVAAVQPDVFIFENVPGLLTGDNQAYAESLIHRLRFASGPNSYAVATATFQAADFGVPQRRRRVFIVGMRGRSVADVHEFFDRVYARRTHASPRRTLRGLQPWRTIADAIPGWGEGNHVWRQWINNALAGPALEEPSGRPSAPEILPKKVQLQWPHRGYVPAYRDDAWRIDPPASPDEPTRIFALSRATAEIGDALSNPWFVSGDPIPALEALRRTYGRRSDLVYVDAPRLETNAASFGAADAQARLDTWLTLMHELVRKAFTVTSDRGVVTVLCGIDELPFVQLLMSERVGPQNHVGTIAWQKGYSPRNMPNMRDVSPVHDHLVIYARKKADLPAIALQIPTRGFHNSDNDPRGPWKAEQKGANKPDYDYAVNIPPYRWRIAGGELPPGIWRLNEKSGVLWGRGEDIQTAGTWKFTVEVTDSSGSRTRKQFAIAVKVDAPQTEIARLPWLIATAGGDNAIRQSNLRVVTSSLPDARLGHEYSACLVATGGTPWLGTTRPGKASTSGKGRYWEFPESNLLLRAGRDSVDFKSKDDAIPALKTYLDGQSRAGLNQMSIWFGLGRDENDPFGVGYSQDAKKELEALQNQGVISRVVAASKPARLMTRLLALFTTRASVVIDIGSPAGEMAALATACNRRVVHVALPGEAADEVVLPRMKLASRGEHPVPSGVIFDTDETSSPEGAAGYAMNGAARPKSTDAGVSEFTVGPPAATLDKRAGSLRLNYSDYPPGSDRFLDVLSNLEGLVPRGAVSRNWFATSLDGRTRAAYIHSDEYLDIDTADAIRKAHEEHLATGGRVRVYYHRGEASVQDEAGPGSLETRLVPFELQLMAGVL